MQIGFNNEEYVKLQSEKILERINNFNNKLYLEFGGKLFDDYHAARVLPGFDVNGKVRLLQKLTDTSEIILCINAGDIEKNKVRSDIGITYDMDVLRLIDNLRSMKLYINSVVITQYSGQHSADVFKKRLEMRGIKTYVHKLIPGYPTDIDYVVSDEGFGKNEYIETTRPLVVVTAPGPGSGKLATCLSQVYHEYTRGISAGYAKFETFPIWNLSLKHPVNMAYEAATADLNDINMIDPFHLEAYETTAVSYNRDIVAFPIVKTIISKITGDSTFYQSPTDMGVNMAGYAIRNDEVVRNAANQEIIRRYLKVQCDYKKGFATEETLVKCKTILKQLNLSEQDRAVVKPANDKCELTGVPCMSIELPDGTVVTGKNSTLMNAPASVIINAIKTLAGIQDEIRLISPIILEPIFRLKSHSFNESHPTLNLEDVLIALSICAATNPMVELALQKLEILKNCQAHSTHILQESDEGIFRKLGIDITCGDKFPTSDLYYV